jgi:hypothetical protein
VRRNTFFLQVAGVAEPVTSDNSALREETTLVRVPVVFETPNGTVVSAVCG